MIGLSRSRRTAIGGLSNPHADGAGLTWSLLWYALERANELVEGALAQLFRQPLNRPLCARMPSNL
jgi:hypothetical protein